MSVDFEKDLDFEQLSAVRSEAQFVRVIAGAGSGKTRVLTYRFAYLMQEKHVLPNEILCITFTNRAADEMKLRIRKLTHYDGRTIRTLNSLGNQILKNEIYRIGWDNNYEICGTVGDQIKKLKEICDSLGGLNNEVSVQDVSNFISKQKSKLEYYNYVTKPDETDLDEQIQAYRSNAARLFEELEKQSAKACNEEENSTGEEYEDDDEEPEDEDELYESEDGDDDDAAGKEGNDANRELKRLNAELKNALLHQIYYQYLKLQAKQHFTDFDDQLCLSLMMFDAFPDMLDDWSGKYRHILVDEFQDSSTLNYKLCLKLTGDNNSLFVVGDPDQMIYGWRGANCDYIKNFAYEHSDAQSYTLKKNYRSTKAIIDVANRLIRNNSRTHDSNRQMLPTNESDCETVKYYHAPFVFDAATLKVEDTEAQKVAERIKELLEQGVKGKDIAVLYRRHISANGIKKALKQLSIKYHENNEDDSFEYPLNRKLVMLLKLIASSDSFDSEDFLSHIRQKEEASALNQLFFEEGKDIAFDELSKIILRKTDIFPESALLIESVLFGRQMIEEDPEYSLYDLVEEILARSGITDEANAYMITEELVSLDSFKDSIRKLESETDEQFTLNDYLDLIRNSEDDDSTVQLFTIHAAKGLEFDYVFTVQMCNSIMPGISLPAIFSDPEKQLRAYNDLEEERRVAYVAYTRAMKELWLTDNAESIGALPSHFILEGGLADGCIEQIGESLSEEEISEIEGNYNILRGTLYGIETAAIEKRIAAIDEVIHSTYGHGRIVKMINGGVRVRFDSIDRSLNIYDLSTLKPVLPEVFEQAINNEELIRQITQPDEQDNPLTKRIKRVLALINEAAADQEHKEQISVLTLPCGTGKSSAVSRKICQVVEEYRNGSKEGLLIMSNRIAQLEEYLMPYGDDMKLAIRQCRDYIVQLDKDSTRKEIKRAKHAPVLIITTQKYLGRDYFDIVSNYLPFGKDCMRTLIIVDEEPEVYKSFAIGTKELIEIDTGIKEGIRSSEAYEDKQFCIQYWTAWKAHLEGILSTREALARQNQLTKYYDYVIDRNDHSAEWCSQANTARFFDIIRKYRFKINFSNDGMRLDVLECMNALQQMRRFGALYEYCDNPYYNRFVMRIGNEILFNPALGSKIIILDGTADISPTYCDPALFHLVGTSEFKRDLSNLTIVLHNQAASKSSLRLEDKMDAVVNIINKEIAPTIPKGEQWAVFTSEEIETRLVEKLRRYRIKHNHFNNIRGSNEYKDLKYIVQVGVLRWADSFYHTYEIESDPDYQTSLITDVINGRSVDEKLKEGLIDSFTKDCRNRLLLCDIEQNIFRGIIRRSDIQDRYTFHLILSFREYKDLIDMITRRFQDERNATVTLMGRSEREEAFFEWHANLKKGERYTGQRVLEELSRVAEGCTKFSDFYRNYPRIKEQLDHDMISKGVYLKRTESEGMEDVNLKLTDSDKPI